LRALEKGAEDLGADGDDCEYGCCFHV
jgi:hypothetical protein